jgi:hypothetical protein
LVQVVLAALLRQQMTQAEMQEVGKPIQVLGLLR